MPPLTLLSDATHVYFSCWTDDRYAELFRVAKGTTKIERMTEEKWSQAYGIHVDSSFVYLHADNAAYDVPLRSPSRPL